MADHDTPGGRAEKRARIIAAQALREAAAPPVARRGGRRRNSGPIWTTPAPIVAAPDAQNGAGEADGGGKAASKPATPSGRPVNKTWRS